MTFTFGVDPAVTPPANDGGGDAGFFLTSGTGTTGTALATPGTIQSLSIYIASGCTGAEHILLGLYDNSGTGSQAGALKASAVSTVAVNGWQTINVITPVLLSPANYWFAVTPDSVNPVFGTESASAWTNYIGSQPYSLPSTAPTMTANTTQLFAMYATLAPVASMAQWQAAGECIT